MTDLRVTPLSATRPYGVIVSGLRKESLEEAGVREKLKALWIEHGLIVFRDIDRAPEMHVKLSGCFGPLESHPLKAAYSSDRDEITEIRYAPGESTVYEVRGEKLGGWLPWHSDLAYVDRINRGGILKAVELPERGGDTGFVDQISAYDALPDRLKSRIEGLHVAYRLELDATRQRFGGERELKVLRLSPATIAANATAARRPRSVHPIAYVQPESGRRVLNVSPWFATGILEMPGEDGDALLAEVIDYAISPDLAYYHRWRSTDEMLLWDNWRMIHCATGVPAHLTRRMERTTISGDYALGRWEDASFGGIDGPVYSI